MKKMSLEDILKEKEEIMDMIYNVGWIFFASPVLMPLFVSILMIGTGSDFEGSFPGFGAGIVAIGSIQMSGFFTMIYMTYKMMNIKEISFVSLLRILAKIFLKRFS
jgi:hypothetical protein